MIPIMIASFISLAVFLERLWTLRRTQILPEDFIRLIFQKVSENKRTEAITLCEGNRSTASTIISNGLRRSKGTRTQSKEAFEEIGQIEVTYLSSYVEVLGTIATITPLMGLLGTVIGMIDVFRAVVAEVSLQGGAVNPASLAGGIWSALITTAAGLSAAIPAFIGYKYLLAHLDRIAVELEEVAIELLDLLHPEGMPEQDLREEGRLNKETQVNKEKIQVNKEKIQGASSTVVESNGKTQSGVTHSASVIQSFREDTDQEKLSHD